MDGRLDRPDLRHRTPAHGRGSSSPAHFVVPSDEYVARHIVEGGTSRQVEMQLFEVTLPGFDGSTDETDDLVVWVAAPEEKVVRDTLEGTGAAFCGIVEAALARPPTSACPSPPLA